VNAIAAGRPSYRSRVRLTLSLAALIPSTTFAQASPAPDSLRPAIALALTRVLSSATAVRTPGLSLDRAARSLTRSLYQRAGQSALWLTGTGNGARVDALLEALVKAPTQALRVDGYGLDSLAAALVRARAQPTATVLADADVRLTSAFVAYGTDLLIGQVDPRTVTTAWHIDPKQTDVDAILASVRCSTTWRFRAR
jgi:hypothetical protein